MILVDLRKARKVFAIAVVFFIILSCIFIINSILQDHPSLNPNEIKYSEHIGLNGKILYTLPSNWKTYEEKFAGDEIIYHNNFISEDRKINGYVEVWNLNMPLKDFLNLSKKSAVGVGIVSFKSYSIEQVKINGREGFILQYTRADNKGGYIKAFEVFIGDEKNMFHRFAFYMDEKLWKEDLKMVFLNIAASLEIK